MPRQVLALMPHPVSAIANEHVPFSSCRRTDTALPSWFPSRNGLGAFHDQVEEDLHHLPASATTTKRVLISTTTARL